MSTSRNDRNVNLNIHDNRGLATLVGFVTVLVLSRLLWIGVLDGLIGWTFRAEGMQSATYMLLAFAANLVWGIGTVIIVAWSGLWWLVMDIIAGIREWTEERRARREMVSAVAVESVRDAVETPEVEADEPAEDEPENPVVAALSTIDANVRATFGQVQAVANKLEEVDARVTLIEDTYAQPQSAPKTTTTRAKR